MAKQLDYLKIGNKIKEIRQQKGITREKLSEKNWYFYDVFGTIRTRRTTPAVSITMLKSLIFWKYHWIIFF